MTRGARLTVMGAGSWGTALAHVLARNGHAVTLWCRETEVAEGINARRRNPLFLSDVDLPGGIVATADLAAAAATPCDLLVWVVPSQFTRRVLTEAAPHLGPDVAVVSATKGIEVDTLRLVTEVFEDVLGPSAAGRLAALSGPSFAREVVAGMPTAVAAGSASPELAHRVQGIFGSETFRVYTNRDPVGTQIGGALKNVVAIAAGAAEGLGLGHNTRAVIITRGLAEIRRLGLAMGALAPTFAGLAGLGDLVLTCTGGLSRNRQVGVALGQGKRLPDILSGMGEVAEGVKTTAAAHRLAQRHGVAMPIVEQVHRTLFEGATVKEAMENLMARPQKPEADFS
jgi:glycerol-3-phosphate dehydrogenase (NAD(P)+)